MNTFKIIFEKTLMMKKIILITLLSSNLAFAQIQTPQASPSAKIEQTVGLTKVNVEYSRPAIEVELLWVI